MIGRIIGNKMLANKLLQRQSKDNQWRLYMTPTSHEPIMVNRTEHGLTICGTRITIYDVMDHLEAGWAPKLVLN